MQTAGRKQRSLAALIYIYDHHQRELPKRLTRDFHDHYDLALEPLIFDTAEFRDVCSIDDANAVKRQVPADIRWGWSYADQCDPLGGRSACRPRVSDFAAGGSS
jgi:hypothetical protein